MVSIGLYVSDNDRLVRGFWQDEDLKSRSQGDYCQRGLRRAANAELASKEKLHNINM